MLEYSSGKPTVYAVDYTYACVLENVHLFAFFHLLHRV